MDRALLAQQRQMMRAKESGTMKTTGAQASDQKRKSKKRTSMVSITQSSASSMDEVPSRRASSRVTRKASIASSLPSRKTSLKSAKRPSVVLLGNNNISLLVRQVLQRQNTGSVKEYLVKTSKEELFDLTYQIASYSFQIKEQFDQDRARMEADVINEESQKHEVTTKLLHTENKLVELEATNDDLEQRLVYNANEYKTVVAQLQEVQERWNSAQSTINQEQLLLKEMSKSLEARTQQMETLKQELQEARESLRQAQTECTHFKNQMQVRDMDAERMEKAIKEERRENKAVLWELQSKTNELNDLTNQLEEARGQILTLEGELQVEIITRQSNAQERDAAHTQLRHEREDWKCSEELRQETERRKAVDMRNMDMEIRQLKQVVGRLRSELEVEQTQRNKAEMVALKVTKLADELKAEGKTLQQETHRLSTELQEEKSTREAKEGALAIAYRELQSVHKRLRDEETARVNAQAEVEALIHRMKLLRRDRLANFNHAEQPEHLISRWKEPIEHQVR